MLREVWFNGAEITTGLVMMQGEWFANVHFSKTGKRGPIGVSFVANPQDATQYTVDEVTKVANWFGSRGQEIQAAQLVDYNSREITFYESDPWYFIHVYIERNERSFSIALKSEMEDGELYPGIFVSASNLSADGVLGFAKRVITMLSNDMSEQIICAIEEIVQ